MTRSGIVVGLDDSPSARAALFWAARQALLTGSVLRAVHVEAWAVEMAPLGFAGPAEFIALPQEDMNSAHRTRITAVFDQIDPRPDWLLQFAQGDAGVALVAQAEHADLLVVGTREHVGIKRILAGSVSHYCLSHASCPIVAVPAPWLEGQPQGPSVPAG